MPFSIMQWIKQILQQLVGGLSHYFGWVPAILLVAQDFFLSAACPYLLCAQIDIDPASQGLEENYETSQNDLQKSGYICTGSELFTSRL